MESKGRALKAKKMTAREWKARDPQGYAEANGHCWPPYPHAKPFSAQAWLEAQVCDRWGMGPDGCIEDRGHVGPCRDMKGNTTLTLAAQII